MTNVWAIKLGSGGRCVPFCEKHKIIGVGWRGLDERVVATRDRDAMKKHLAQHYPGDNQALEAPSGSSGASRTSARWATTSSTTTHRSGGCR